MGLSNYYLHHSVRPPRCNDLICLIALEIVQLGQNVFFSVGSNIWRSTSLVLSSALETKGVTFAISDSAGHCFCWSRFPLDVISDSGRYFEMSVSVSPGRVSKDPSLIA